LGIVGLFRPKELGNFSEKDFGMIKILTPYLSQSLKNEEIYRKIQHENSIFKMVDKNLSSGIIIFDDSMRLIYMNGKAKDFCKFILGMEYDVKHREVSYSEKYHLFVPYMIKEDCHRLKEQMKNGLNITPLPIYKIFKMSSFRKYSICSQVITKEMSPENQLFYMTQIDGLISNVTLDMKTLENDFNLTKREIEILENLFNGLKNTEIAEKLFITEFTVKTHLQHIFEKIGVNSRTTLIRKIIEYQCPQPQGSNQL
jgi:DNA-binding CsgD family transcriptional regulator